MIHARAPRSRSWLGCLNNYSNAELEQLKAHECRYMALGFHVGLKSGLPHVHIDVEYKTMKTRPKFNARIHWEPRRGTLKQALDYLNKEDKLEERGDRPRLNTSIATNFEDMYEDAKKGLVHPECMMYARFQNYFDNLANAAIPPDKFRGELDTKNLWIWGDTGTGKSGLVFDCCVAENAPLYRKRKNKWWDGYIDQPYVLIEDVDENDCKFLGSMLKEWSDRYQFLGEYKGHTRVILPTFRLIVTSNHSPEECIENRRDLEAILRRFEVYHDTKRSPSVAAPPRPANPTPPCSQTYESETELASSWH